MPEAVPTRNGAHWPNLDGQLCALFTQAIGEQVARTAQEPVHAAAAGKALAQLHLALESLPDLGWRRYPVRYDPLISLARLDAIGAAIRKVAAPDEADACALQRVREQAEWLADARCSHAADLNGPRQMIHGDYHDANLFFSKSGEQVTGVIDWEQAAWMPRAFEAMRCAHYVFRLCPTLAATFLASYAASLEMNTVVLDAAALSYGVQADHGVWALEEAYLHGNARTRVFIPHAPFRTFGSFWREVQERLEL